MKKNWCVFCNIHKLLHPHNNSHQILNANSNFFPPGGKKGFLLLSGGRVSTARTSIVGIWTCGADKNITDSCKSLKIIHLKPPFKRPLVPYAHTPPCSVRPCIPKENQGKEGACYSSMNIIIEVRMSRWLEPVVGLSNQL